MKRKFTLWITVSIFLFVHISSAQVVIDKHLERTLTTTAGPSSLLFPLPILPKLEVIVAFHGSGPATASQIRILNEVGIFNGIAFRSFPIVGVLATSTQINLLRNRSAIRSIFANRQLQYFNARSTEVTGVDMVRVDTDIIAQNGGVPVTGKGVGILINDSGVDGTHADIEYNGHLVQNVLGTLNLVGSLGILPALYVEDVQSTDTNSGHGTHCAGIVGGTGEMSNGKFEGVAPGAALIGYGSGVLISILDALGGLDYAALNQERYGIRVVSNSWGTSGEFDPADPINVATKVLYDRGINVVFAAGNEGPSAGTLNPYSRAPWVISVAAGDANRQLADFSSRGVANDQRTITIDGETWIVENRPTLTAPGVGVISTRAISPLPVLATADDINNLTPAELPYYTHMSGTSMAAPHVAGIIALLLEVHPGLAPADIKQIIQFTSRQMPGYQTWEAGWGYVNAYDAVNYVLQIRPQPGVTTQAVTSSTAMTMEAMDAALTNKLAAYPNPVTNNLTIDYTLADDTKVNITLLDRFGNEVATLVNTFQRRGLHQLRLEKNGVNLRAGVYMARMEAGKESKMLRLVVTD